MNPADRIKYIIRDNVKNDLWLFPDLKNKLIISYMPAITIIEERY